MADIIMNDKSFIKPILHAIKYPHCSVNGVFIGKKSEDGMKLADAIPLFHSSLSLAPMLEVALFQIDAYCQMKNLSIVGYYHANEIISDVTPNPVASKIADKVKENYSDAFLLMMNNSEVMEGGRGAYIVHTKHDNKWKPALDRSISVTDETLNTCFSRISFKGHRDLHDFDNHLDDLSKDWLNQAVNQALTIAV